MLVIEQIIIYGISPEGGEVLFEIRMDFEIKSVIDMIEGCLLCIDSRGNFKLIEIFYETGAILATWHLKYENSWTLEQATIHKISEKFNLIIKMRNELLGEMILAYSIDPQIKIVPCTFRYWIVDDNCNDKNLPFIVRKNFCSEKLLITVRIA